MLTKDILGNLYFKKKLSVTQIGRYLNVNPRTVEYWMNRHSIKRRSRSEALYTRLNPKGDPFKLKQPFGNNEYFLKGLGLGLFWGEGTKRTKDSVKLGNTDSFLILKFREFLTKICGVPQDKIKYSLQVFGDVSKDKAVKYWKDLLWIKTEQLGKVTILPHRGVGSYKRKSEFGVLVIYVHNKKFKQLIDKEIAKLGAMPT